jgi:hypothetical protein
MCNNCDIFEEYTDLSMFNGKEIKFIGGVNDLRDIPDPLLKFNSNGWSDSQLFNKSSSSLIFFTNSVKSYIQVSLGSTHLSSNYFKVKYSAFKTNGSYYISISIGSCSMWGITNYNCLVFEVIGI